jgi:lysophospholipase L1-like esterase
MTLSTSTVTLAPGSSRTYNLAPGEAVTVATEPNCYVTVTETPDVITTADQGGQTNVRTSILQYKGEWTYGPYALGGTVVVDVSLAKSTSSVSATLGSAAAAVVGAGNAGSASAYGIGLALFGDSISQNGYYSSSGTSASAWFVPGSTDMFERSWGYGTWIGPLSMQRVRVVKNYGIQTNGLLVPGTSPVGYPLSTQVTAALADPEFVNVDRAVFLVGSNDASAVKADGTNVTIAEATAELLRQIARINKPVTLATVPPRGGTVTAVVGDSLRLWAWLAEWRVVCKRIADNSRGRVAFVDAYRLLNSPTTVPDVFAAGYTYDNIHPNNAGAYLIADAIVSSLIPTGISGDLDLWPTNTSAATTGATKLDQGFANPTMGTASGGSGTGTIAANLTVTNIGTATHSGSVIANPNGLGNMQRIAITSNAAADGVNVATDSFHAAGTQFLSEGDEAYVQMLVTVNSGGIYPRNMRCLLTAFNGTTTYLRMLHETDPTKEVALPLLATRSFLMRTPTFVMSPGAALTNLQGTFRATFAGAGACTIDIGNIECRRSRSGGVYY